MFGISLGEVLIICIVTLILIKPEELPLYISLLKKFFIRFKNLQEIINCNLKDNIDLKNYTQEIDNKIKTIIGEDGKEYESFELPKELLENKKDF